MFNLTQIKKKMMKYILYKVVFSKNALSNNNNNNKKI